MKARGVIVYCGLLMSISAFATDITLPAFPEMAASLDAPYAMVQWTITVYMFTAGFGQLLWGAASDRFGRRPVVAAGLATFLAGGLGTVFAPSIEVLLAGRALQGFGAAAAIVLPQAIIRDLFTGRELARNLAFASAVFAFGPIVAPLAGAGIAALFGWRAIFAALAVFALLLLAGLLRVPETLARPNPGALSPAAYRSGAARLAAHPQSRHFLWLSAMVMASMFLILVSAPHLYETGFGITGTVFAAYFAVHGTGIVVGQIANRRLIAAVGIVRAMLLGNCVLVLSAGLILGFALAGLMTPWLLALLFVLYATSLLIVYSNAAAMVLDPHGDIAGFAASAYGFVSRIGGSLIVSALVLATGTSMIGFAAALLAICLVCLAGIAAWMRRG